MRAPEILLTCEHGGNRVPSRYAECFRDAAGALAGHEGSDLGALTAARRIADVLGAPLYGSTVTRLLVDLNRSPGHPRLFSRFTSGLPPERRQRVVEQHYRPHRDRVEGWVRERVSRRLQVLHISVHSFTPVLDGAERDCDVGLLYDSSRIREKALCRSWAGAIRTDAAGIRVRRNYPYRGSSDGFTTRLRRVFPARHYLGIELELNQRALLCADRKQRKRLLLAVADGLRRVLDLESRD